MGADTCGTVCAVARAVPVRVDVSGALAGRAVRVLVAGVIVPALTPVSQAEGAYAMGVIFLMAPAGAVLGAKARDNEVGRRANHRRKCEG